ncbi:MAG: CCA tRNA nucleotidyltransferase [Rhizobiaceae bacterium]|nr:CCA tRNA nucleotidyltransferase [Rhizobiaceae bacterium]
MSRSIASAGWLHEETLQRLLKALSQDGEQARIAGGAVRNELLGEPVADVDIATTHTPPMTAYIAAAEGFRAVNTGGDHGTITVVAGGRPYEVTTLRADIETDGRRATVRFGRDWVADAERRDFTINALYAEADGTVVDLVGGLADVETRTLRFIGDAEQRIREDYLRILRFFRFFAWFGGGRPDAAGLKACTRLKDGLETLSAERVWSEMKKLLSAPDPARALLWMRQTGVLTKVLPESEKWGIDGIHALIRAETDLGWAAEPMLRLEAIVPPDEPRMRGLANRLKMSLSERDRLVGWAASPVPKPETSEGDLARMLYRGAAQGIFDRLRLALASARARGVEDDKALSDAAGFSRQVKFLDSWELPEFPLKGRDLSDLGMKSGPEMGKLLKELEAVWIESGFALSREALLDRARAKLP